MRAHQDKTNVINRLGSGIEPSILDTDGVFQNHINTTAIKVSRLPCGSVRLSIVDHERESALLLSPKEAAHLSQLLS